MIFGGKWPPSKIVRSRRMDNGVGLTAYADELAAVERCLLTLHNGCVYLIPCPMLLMKETNKTTMIRSMIDSIMTDTISYCSATMKVALSMLFKNQVGTQVAPMYCTGCYSRRH